MTVYNWLRGQRPPNNPLPLFDSCFLVTSWVSHPCELYPWHCVEHKPPGQTHFRETAAVWEENLFLLMLYLLRQCTEHPCFYVLFSRTIQTWPFLTKVLWTFDYEQAKPLGFFCAVVCIYFRYILLYLSWRCIYLLSNIYWISGHICITSLYDLKSN